MNRTERAKEIRKVLSFLAQTLSDDAQIIQISELYPRWQPQRFYQIDEVVSFEADGGDTRVYRCLQGHLSQENWVPETEPALWKRIGREGNLDLWVQPLGAADAYQRGGKVSHRGVGYISTVDNNVWEPGVYGWEVVVS